jgi:release factor glutamine methyltransferase
MTGSITLLEVVRRSTTFLAERGSESPRLDAELLSAHVLGLRRLDVYLQFDRLLRDGELEPIRGLLRRRAAGEPVAYLLGEKEFCGRAFMVTPSVLIPRPETELLVERVLLWARATAPPGGARIIDTGTGSGCVAVTLAAELPQARLLASDVSGEATLVAEANAARHGVGDRCTVSRGSWLEPFDAEPPVDALVSNPPYVTTSEFDSMMRDVRDFEPRVALDGGDDGLDAYRAIVAAASARLRRGGLIALEIDPRRRAAVESLVVESWPGSQVTVSTDLSGRERVVEACLPQ